MWFNCTMSSNTCLGIFRFCYHFQKCCSDNVVEAENILMLCYPHGQVLLNFQTSCLCTPCKSTCLACHNRQERWSQVKKMRRCSKKCNLNQTKQLQTNSPMTRQQPAWPRFNIQYKVTTHYQISERTLPSRALVCVYWATAFMSWLCWVRGSLKSGEDIAYQWPESAGILSCFLKCKAPWSYSARWVVQCHTATKSRYQVCHEVMCGLWFLLLRFVLQGRSSLWISPKCDINDRIKVLKLCCTKNKLNEAMYMSF